MSSVLKISGTAFASAHRPAVKTTMSAGERRIMWLAMTLTLQLLSKGFPGCRARADAMTEALADVGVNQIEV